MSECDWCGGTGKLVTPAMGEHNCPECDGPDPDDACVYRENVLCRCWVRLANGVECPYRPDDPTASTGQIEEGEQ